MREKEEVGEKQKRKMTEMGKCLNNTVRRGSRCKRAALLPGRAATFLERLLLPVQDVVPVKDEGERCLVVAAWTA